MRIIFALLVLTCSLAMSNATLKLLKSKVKPTSLIYPVTNRKTVKYLAAPVLVTEPLTATYARPVSTYGALISKYSYSLPPTATYAAPVPAYEVPYVYESYSAPAAVYAQPFTVAYDTPVVVHYSKPENLYFEPLSPYGAHVVEEHYSD